MGGTRGSGVVSSADNVLEMSGVGGMCEMCVFGSGWMGLGVMLNVHKTR